EPDPISDNSGGFPSQRTSPLLAKNPVPTLPDVSMEFGMRDHIKNSQMDISCWSRPVAAHAGELPAVIQLVERP
ncbi:hypothetical protein, partial [Xanthomonas citri]|uniref:hypothetical protein n=1 Tax=Xanthomonas citri TaxID=346 RepID=UPI0024DFEAED